MDEPTAIRRLKQGDLRGLETLVRTYQVRATRAAYLIVQDAQLAEDVAADAFLRALDRIDTFDTERPFGPWFYRIVINLAQRTASRGQRSVSLEAPVDPAGLAWIDNLADDGPGPEEIVEAAEFRERVWSALQQLTPAQRAAVVQRYYLDWSETEMAAETKCAPGTIKWRLHTARQRLREWLRP